MGVTKMSGLRLSQERAVLFACAVCLCAVLASGCGDDKTKVEPIPEVPSRGTPNDLLEWYAEAIEQEDLGMYEEALHDYFIHEFPLIVADSLGLPSYEPWWGKTAEMASMAALFQDSTVAEIEFEFTHATAWTPAQMSIGLDSLTTGILSRTDPVMRVRVQESGEEPKTLVFDKTYFDIFVVRDPKFPDQNLYVIARIEEVLKNPL